MFDEGYYFVIVADVVLLLLLSFSVHCVNGMFYTKVKSSILQGHFAGRYRI